VCNIYKRSSEKPAALRECRRCHNLRLVPEGSVLFRCFIVMSTRRKYDRPGLVTFVGDLDWVQNKFLIEVMILSDSSP